MTKIRIYMIDADNLEIRYFFDEKSEKYIGSYPDFEEKPRYTPNGRPWRNVIMLGCPYADPVYKDCGTCSWLIKEAPNDLIGVCYHESYQKIQEKSLKNLNRKEGVDER